MKEIQGKNNCSLFRFSQIRNSQSNITRTSASPHQETLLEGIKKGYTLYPGWLHPLGQMATPSGSKGVALSEGVLSGQTKSAIAG